MIKRKRLSESCQLTLIELKVQKEPWNYNHPEHVKVIKPIAEIIALDSQLFSIVEDTGFIRLLAHDMLYHQGSTYFSERIIPDMYTKGYLKIFILKITSLLASQLTFGPVMVVSHLSVGLHITSIQSFAEKNKCSRFVIFQGLILQMPYQK